MTTTATTTAPRRRARDARRRRPGALAAALAATALALTACTGPSGADDLRLAPEEPQESASESAAPAPAPAECSDPLASYAPDGDLPAPDALPAGSTMAEIRERGVLRVGVSADTLLMGSRDPLSGEIEGFDIDVLREVSRAIFGDPDRLQFRVITSGQRIEVLQEGDVDLVARAFTMNCDRWEQIAFSAEYYHAGQKVLVTRDSDASGIADLEGQRVCAPEGTTTLDRLGEFAGIEAVPATTHTQCLVLFQQGRVDAITGDDTILAGFAAQDPYAKVVGEAISDEPYGVGANAEDVDLVRFVNGVLERMTSDGTWEASYDRWLGVLGDAPAPPSPVYGRTP
ncbi:glutamate ABC transporter substrate-binding protein [Cellulosimicrobium marinum]|uniref:glutamate ABC transporter substrate-binding protein n=1 Tax=Cellulosimicrobium marinum TaxID=1638992 RepID=UPI001E4B9AD7|nr:glutamate ABC transporter substrate-binding protein [Cellulosimicrobium marinum]MCB7136382.1 glutamate ABC transporter substrate-binding protein [Cellulosimicrobium marinum]